VVSDTVLAIEGSGLRGDQTFVRIGPEELTPAAVDTNATSIRISLSTATSLRPGLQPLVIAHRWLVGDPAEPRAGEISNAVGVFVSATITAAAGGGELTLTSDLEVGVRQQASVSLLAPATGATVRVLDIPARSADTSTLTVSLADVPNGQYGVSLSVDGASSPLTRNNAGVITGPVVTVS